MPDDIKETVPKVLKTLWDLENELRGAAQNSVVLRREEAKKHLAEARQHLDDLLSLVRSHDGAIEPDSASSADDDIPPQIKH
ncbi:hypothetical protein [Hyphomicrobium sp.]|uniref:hypothetical protein n=1 Tax=Hyphomicrobium sp. TaxID=82 RepID=UPI0025C61C1A|nr:hypothetical protein [Hyphomicrobium sp.]